MTTQAATRTYAIDAMHSTAEFSVKHMMVSNVKGRFRDLEGELHIDAADPTRSSVEAVLKTASIDTGVEMRDNDLRSDNFFAADRFPEIRFVSQSVVKLDDAHWQVAGDLTIRDVTREVVLATELEGQGPGFDGKERLGFSAETTVSRKDFGLNYNAVLETGGVVVGDKVKIVINVEAVSLD